MAPPAAYKEMLKLTPGKKQSFSFLHLLHMIFLTGPWLLIRIPIEVFIGHILPFFTFYIFKSEIVREIGRPAVPDIVVRFVRFFLAKGSPAEGRATFFGRNLPYTIFYNLPSWRKHKAWLKYVKEPGFTGRWIADHNTQRADDDVVLFFTHGGGFVIDTGGTCQLFWLHLMKELFLKRGIKFSIFQLDYELAPDYQFPSQIIEVTAAYTYLVNKLGIHPSKICISGDSAGANIVPAALLHLARPSHEINVPASFGAVPPKPGASLLISPFIKFLSDSHSYGRNRNFDFIEGHSAAFFAMQYMGCAKIPTVWGLSFHPSHIFMSPHPDPKSYLLEEVVPEMSDAEKAQQLPTIKSRLANPYANPGSVVDKTWWREAMPEQNMMTWGGKEIFADDIGSFAVLLDDAGVPLERLKKQYGVHDWLLYEPSIPWLRKNKSKGPENEPDWGVNHVADFLEKFAKSNKETSNGHAHAQ